MSYAEINANTALQYLERFSSEDDPIWYKGEETTPRDLLWDNNIGTVRAGKVRITYYGGPPNECRMIRNGTLSAMVRNREVLSGTRNVSVCPTCGQEPLDTL